MIFSYLLNMQSHPSWVCGLKLRLIIHGGEIGRSHPSWVCGLKRRWQTAFGTDGTSHPSWVCGLKLLLHGCW